MEPVNNSVLVKLIHISQTRSDIELAEEENDRNLIAGEIVESSHPDWQKGQVIVFGKYAIATFKYQGEEYHFLPAEDIVGIL